MDEETKARFLTLVDCPVASLSVRDVGFLLGVLDEHEEEALDLRPELKAFLDL